VLANLAVGPCTLEVARPGFQSYVQPGILLQVGNNVQVHVALQVGAVTEEVQVAANATMVETQDTSISEVVIVATVQQGGRFPVQWGKAIPVATGNLRPVANPQRAWRVTGSKWLSGGFPNFLRGITDSGPKFSRRTPRNCCPWITAN
jgi:hypothetical protein